MARRGSWGPAVDPHRGPPAGTWKRNLFVTAHKTSRSLSSFSYFTDLSHHSLSNSTGRVSQSWACHQQRRPTPSSTPPTQSFCISSPHLGYSMNANPSPDASVSSSPGVSAGRRKANGSAPTGRREVRSSNAQRPTSRHSGLIKQTLTCSQASRSPSTSSPRVSALLASPWRLLEAGPAIANRPSRSMGGTPGYYMAPHKLAGL